MLEAVLADVIANTRFNDACRGNHQLDHNHLHNNNQGIYDIEQYSVIEENNDIIKKSQENIGKALDVIKQNERYKSILYTNGDELVEVVFEVLEKMLG